MVKVYLLLYAAPILFGASFNLVYLPWLASILLAWQVAPQGTDGKFVILGKVFVSALLTFLNLLLASSLYLQGTGFNEQFFFHLDGPTFAIAREAFPELFFGAWLLWLVQNGLLFFARIDSAQPPVFLRMASLVGVVCFLPFWSLLFSAFERLQNSQSAVPLAVERPVIPIVDMSKRRNVILLFAESLESTFSDPEVFGNALTPELTQIERTGLTFSDIRQKSHTGWTLGGMVGAHCALPVSAGRGSNSLFASVDVPLSQQICLADVLKRQGYQTLYMGGAPLAFAGKGKFLSAHGYDVVLGKNDFLPRLEGKELSPWGVYDQDLFMFAKQELGELKNKGEPFLFSLLTLDTHHPSGLASPDCVLQRAFKPMMNAVICSQKRIAEFVDHVRKEFPEAVIVLFSDHLAMRNDLTHLLEPHQDKRRLRFTIWGVGEGEVDSPGTHFDVMPTLMDILGVEDFVDHHMGRSLLAFDSGGWFDDDREEIVLSAEELGDLARFEPQVEFLAVGPSIKLGQRKVLASKSGMPLNNGVFAIEFDSEGNINRYLNGARSADFLAAVGDKALVGISANREFNTNVLAQPASSKLTFFYRTKGVSEYQSGQLWWREKIELTEDWLGGG